MNCPKCEAQSSPAQKFCRFCGENLQAITKPLAETAVAPALEKMVARAGQWKRMLPVWGFVIMFLGLMLSITSTMLHLDKAVTLSGALTSVIGVFLIGLPSVLALSRPSNPQKKISAAPTNQTLPPENQTDYVSSITERTTNLLNYPISTEAKRQTSGELRS